MAPGFSCVVSGWFFLAFVLVVQSAKDFKFVESPTVSYPIEGETLAVTCSAEGKVSKVEFRRRDNLGIIFEEMKNTSRVYTTSKREGNLTTSVLHFKTVELSDDSSVPPNRRYSCWVFGIPNTTKETLDFHITVTPKDALPIPYPATAVVLNKNLGEYVELKCNITVSNKKAGVELKSLHWKRNNKIIQTKYTQDGEFKKDLDVLKFPSVSLADVGNYSCIMETTLAKNRKLNITAGPFVVNIIPEFTDKKTESKVARKGQAVSFECSAVGFPLSIEWKVKLKYETTWNTIEPNPCNETRHCIKSEENELQITDVQYSDRGFYNCCVVRENSTGSDCQKFVLRVRDPLGPLWPVLGIIIEVILLFVIIYFTQKKTKSKAAAGNRADGRAEFSYSSTDDGDRGQLRLRTAADQPKET